MSFIGFLRRATLHSVALVAVSSMVVVSLGVAAPALATPDSMTTIGLHPAQWTATHDGKPKYPKVNLKLGAPITLRDGTVLRADVYRPADRNGRPINEKMPVIVNITPYSKLVTAVADLALHIPVLTPAVLSFINSLNFSGTPISSIGEFQRMLKGGMLDVFGVDRKLIQSGYTQVVVEARGTGGSQGVWQVFNEIEQLDTLDVLEWARTQRWSNGITGMSGVSYSAINQMQVAARHPKGLKAIVPVEPMTDIVPDIVAPGGGLGVGFLAIWLSFVNAIKVMPELGMLLRGKIDPKWLRSRLSDPLVYFKEIVDALTKSDPKTMAKNTRDLIQANSKLRESFRTDTAKIQVPTLAFGGWNDIFTNAEWRTLDLLSGLTSDKKKIVMGTGYHTTPGADMGRKNQPPRLNVMQRAWFDKWLKGIDNGIDRYANATSHQVGGGWVQSDSFPRPGQDYRRMYLNSKRSGTAPHAINDGSLTASAPTTLKQWTVAPGLNTLCSGDSARDTIGIIGVLDMCSKDNRIAEANALTFTSPRVSKATRVTGPLTVHLRAKLKTKDGIYAAVVSDVGPDGRSRVLSTGNMTVSVRNQLDKSRSSYAPNGDLTDPYYELDLYHRELVTPGQSFDLDIGMLATDALIKPGHRIRVSIYALNLSRAVSLGPVSKLSGFKAEHVMIDPAHPSWVNLSSSRPIG